MITTLRICPITLSLLATTACKPPGIELDPAVGEDSSTSADSTTSDGAESGSSETETGDDTTTTSGPSFVSTKFDLPGDNECDAYAQDCPESEKCVPYSRWGGNWDDHKCVPIMGDQATGEPCVYGGVVEATDDCDATGMCWNGTCHAFCAGPIEAPECPEKSGCSISGSGVLNVCLPHCDSLAQDCFAGSACYWTYNEFSCAAAIQNIPAGEPCGFINDCAAGLICLAPELLPACAGAACCSAFCELELGDGQCELIPGTSCVSLFGEDEVLPGYEHVGMCALP